MKINGETRIFGVLGERTEHSLSPAIHNAAFKHLKLNCVFVPFRANAETLETAFRGLQLAGVGGMAVIIPFKEKVLEYCSDLGEKARLIGSVNTIEFREDGSIVGYSTDGDGAARALKEAGVTVKGSRILMLGAGGAARAIAYEMAYDGAASLVLANRTKERAELLCGELNGRFAEVEVRYIGLEKKDLAEASANSDIIIHSSAVGMYPDVESTLLTKEMMSTKQVVFDIVYNPLETRLLREAKAAGAKTVTGDMMLIYQAIEQERIWLGVEPPVQVMLEAFRKANPA